MSKYNSKKVYAVERDGIWYDFGTLTEALRYCDDNKLKAEDVLIFDSRKEYKRWGYLLEQERLSAIYNLQRQVPYTLIPAQYEEYLVTGKRSSKMKRRRLEAPIFYKADFVYSLKDGTVVVEDVKSNATRKLPDYVMKRKLMLYIHGIKLKEII
jgi:hypothetical protein